MLLSALLLALCGQTLPADAPRLLPDPDRSSVTGKSKEWLIREFHRVEEDRPSAGWYVGSLALIPTGLAVVLFGLFMAEVERCGLFNRPCTNELRIGWASASFWVGGGILMLSGAFLTGLIAHLRSPGSKRLDELRRALKDLGPPYAPEIERFDPPEEAPSRNEW